MIKGWNDVNDQLMEIRKLEKQVEAKTKKANAAIREVELRLEKETAGEDREIKRIKKAIEKFARKHSEEFGGKAKKLDAGTVVLRDQVNLIIPDEAVTKKLLAKYYPEALEEKTTISRASLKLMSAEELKEVEVESTKETVCLIQTNKDKKN